MTLRSFEASSEVLEKENSELRLRNEKKEAQLTKDAKNSQRSGLLHAVLQDKDAIMKEKASMQECEPWKYLNSALEALQAFAIRAAGIERTGERMCFKPLFSQVQALKASNGNA